MKRILLSTIIILSLLIGGCGRTDGMKIPKGNKGSATQQEREKKNVTGEIEGEITLPEVPEFGPELDPEDIPPWRVKVDGTDIEVPYGTKGKLTVKTRGSASLDSFTEMLSSWKVNSAPVQLFVFGGIIVAVGVGLIIFGMARIGVVCIGAGIALIACGVVINQYPWVFLIVVLLGLCAGTYFIYNQYKKKKITGDSGDQFYVLEKLTALIERLPEDLQEEYFKKYLREDDKSSMVRRVTRKARGLSK